MTLLGPDVRRRRPQSCLCEESIEGNGALLAVLENLPTNCMVADREFTLVWMNTRAAHTMESLRQVVKQVSGVDVDRMLGGSIRRFHSDPARVERLLRDPCALPLDTLITLGGVALRARVNSVTTRSGDVLGYLALWDEVHEWDGAAGQAAADTARAAEAVAMTFSQGARPPDDLFAVAGTAAPRRVIRSA